jgi:hypothetical protein
MLLPPPLGNRSVFGSGQGGATDDYKRDEIRFDEIRKAS